MNSKNPLILRMAAPRGFCAGVDRAIEMVERAIERYGAPVYVRHEIVHNETVVNRLKKLGAIFVDELGDVPDDRPVLFSAHGVPKSIPAEAERRKLLYLDATCPLVSKVHIETGRHHSRGAHVLLIGHAGHPEVEGTMGQLDPSAMTLIETEEDAQRFEPPAGTPLAYVTQTTLSVDDTVSIVKVLRRRFPNIWTPHKDDICYATTNRQEAVKAIAPDSDILFVVGSPTSSNSQRLVEVGERAGCPVAKLIENVDAIDWAMVEGLSPTAVALTAGASAPESAVQGVVAGFEARYDVTIEEIETTRENVEFKLPRELV